MAERMRDTLWSRAEQIYDATRTHPFISGLTDGSLPHENFRYYIVQDAHYLRDYARALAACATKAPGEAETLMFTEHASGAITAERDLHAGLLSELGLDPAGAAGLPVAPATRAYTSYLLAITAHGSYGEAVAAVLPCYWIYARIGDLLCSRGSPDPLYQRWIDMYAGADFQAVVEAALGAADTAGAAASAAEREAMCSHFLTTARYEWMFWDAAYRLEDWPV